LIGSTLHVNTGVLVVKGGDQLAPVASQAPESVGEGEGDVVLVVALEVGGVVGATNFGGKDAFGRDQFQFGSGQRKVFCTGIAGMLSVVVVEQHIGGGLGGTSEDVPSAGRQFRSGFEEVGIRQPARGDDHDLRVLVPHVIRFGVGVQPHVHAESLHLVVQPELEKTPSSDSRASFQEHLS
jgi:hypothetical protein